ncbi:hypothetical protein ABKN59_005566 [Abortiporus biennis]
MSVNIDSESAAEMIARETTSADMCAIIAITLCYFDLLLTFTDEWRCIWGRRFSGATVFFFINRYFTLVDLTLMLANFVHFPPDSAIKLTLCNEVLEIVLQINVAVIMCLRLYAIWSKSFSVLVLFALLGFAPQVTRIYLYARTSHYKPATPLPVGCGGVSIRDQNLHSFAIIREFWSQFLVWIVIPAYGIVYDALILIMTWAKTAGIRRILKSQQVNTDCSIVIYLLRDGTIYFLCLMILNAVTLMGVKTLTTGGVPIVLQSVTSILISRFMLNLRGVYLPKDDSSDSFHPSNISDLQFASNIVGNLGAPLNHSSESHFEELELRNLGEGKEVIRESSNPLSVGLDLLSISSAITDSPSITSPSTVMHPLLSSYLDPGSIFKLSDSFISGRSGLEIAISIVNFEMQFARILRSATAHFLWNGELTKTGCYSPNHLHLRTTIVLTWSKFVRISISCGKTSKLGPSNSYENVNHGICLVNVLIRPGQSRFYFSIAATALKRGGTNVFESESTIQCSGTYVCKIWFFKLAFARKPPQNDMSDETAEIVNSFWVAFFGTASYVSMAALAVYDYCITFDQELQYIWKKKTFNLSSAIFIVNRYATLMVVLGTAALELFPRTRTVSLCRLSSISWVTHCIAELSRSMVSYYNISHFLRDRDRIFFPVIILDAVFNLSLTYKGLSPLRSPYGGCVLLPSMSDDVHNRYGPYCLNRHRYSKFSRTVAAIDFKMHSLLWTAANQAGIKGTLITLLIRDGTLYLSLTFVLNILEAILFNIHSQAPGIEVILGPVDWLRPIILSRMILDLKSIDQVSMASLPDIRSSRFSSINFVGNIGGPLNTLLVNENDSAEEDQMATSSGATVPRISAKQIIEDPLSIGLFDEKYDNPNVEREFPSRVVEATVEESEV